ncbi:MAG: 3-keto-disaccharide hydrolase [Prolixibacteraceae bacterium]
MKTFQIFTFLVLLVYLNASGQVPDGFEILFNGEDLTGWVVKAKPADEGKNYWTVEDGAIVVNSMGNNDHDYVWLLTETEFDNFELQLKFAAYESSPGNSGIQIRSRYDEEDYWLDGPQIDVHPPEPWRTGFIWDETRGEKRWIYPDLPQDENVNKEMRNKEAPFYYSDDEEKWNELEIYADGNKIQAWLNGEQITNFKNKKILNNEVHLEHEVGKDGCIGLQLHSGDELKMKFKDIFIKEL